jgi:hypothetical protein
MTRFKSKLSGVEVESGHPQILIELKTEATPMKLRLFSLYVDFVASTHVKWAGGTIAKLVDRHCQPQSEMWHLDSFSASQQLWNLMLQDAADADVLIVALSSLDQRESKLIEWLDALADKKTDNPIPGLFIGMLGDEGHEAGELRWTVKGFLSCAQKMGRDFIWQWMGQEAVNDTTWLTDNVQKFLSRKRSGIPRETTADVVHLPEAIWVRGHSPL